MDPVAINCEAKLVTLSCGDDDDDDDLAWLLAGCQSNGSTEETLKCKQENILHKDDYDCNDVFHIAALTESRRNRLADTNSSNSCGLMALDMPYDHHRPQLEIDREIGAMLRDAGALTSRDLTNRRINPGDDDLTTCRMIGSKSSLLLITTLLAVITYQLPFCAHNSIIELNEQDSIMSSSIVLLFNSIVFVASVVTTIFLQHELPMKWLPQLSLSAMFGSYMCMMKATSPNETLALLLISVPFLLLGAVGKNNSWPFKLKSK
ncbi:hypothetical protein U1Q18_014851 [Sarracenia purpurea var. burkii]